MRIFLLTLLIYTFSINLCFSSDKGFVLFPRDYFQTLFNYVDSLPKDEITFVFLSDSTGFSSSNLLFTLKVKKVNRTSLITASDNAEFFFNYDQTQNLPHGVFQFYLKEPKIIFMPPNLSHNGQVYVRVNSDSSVSESYNNDYFADDDFFKNCLNPYPLPSGKTYLTIDDFLFRVLNPYFSADRSIVSGINLFLLRNAQVSFSPYNAFCDNSYVQAYRTSFHIKNYLTYTSDLSDSFLLTLNVPISFSNDMLIIDISKPISFYDAHLKNDIYALTDLIYYIIYYQFESNIDRQYFLRTPFAQSACGSENCFTDPDVNLSEYGLNNPRYGISPQRLIITSNQDDHQLGNIDLNKKPEFDNALFLSLLYNSPLANIIKSIYDRTKSIEETLKLTKPLLDKALLDMPTNEKIINDSVDVLNNMLVSAVLDPTLIDNITTQIVSSGLFDNLSSDGDSKTIVDAVDSLPDKLIGKGDISTVKDPTFDVGIDFDNKSKKSIGLLFDKINLPLMSTLKNSKIELANSSCSVSFYSFGRNVELSLCGFESQLSFIGRLMVAFSTLTSILYVFRRDS